MEPVTRIRYDDPAGMMDWVRQLTPELDYLDDATPIGLERDGRLLGVTVFERFTTHECQGHIVSPHTNWYTPEYLSHCFAYPFIQLDLPRVTGQVAETNLRAILGLQKMGFEPEGRLREALPGGEDIIILGALRRKCRFIPEEHRRGK